MSENLRVYLAQLNATAGDVEGNINLLRGARKKAFQNKSDVLLAPEMFISGYPIDDLVLRKEFLNSIENEIINLAKETNDGGPAIIVGAPRINDSKLRNSVFVLDEGKILGIRDKAKLPNEDEFYDNRQFIPGDLPGPVSIRGVRIGLPICQDLWDSEVCECLVEAGAEIILSINGSTFNSKKYVQRLNTIVARAKEINVPITYLNLVGGQDELLFDGGSFVLNKKGELACQMPMFVPAENYIDYAKFNNVWECNNSVMVPCLEGIEALYNAVVLSIKDYVEKNGFKEVILGLSGGIDSALVAAMSVDALGCKNVKAFMLPSEFTSQSSMDDSKEISKRLDISLECLSITNNFEEINKTLKPVFGMNKFDITEENIQSRLRALLLMAISNKFGSMLISTSNKSESAVGYSTLYGDMSGGFAPLKDLWKTQVFELANWRNLNKPKNSLEPTLNIIPETVINKQPTAELRDNQKDTDSLPDYSRLDQILALAIEEMKSAKEITDLGYDESEVKKVLRLLKNSEYKRFQSPPGPKLGVKAFGRDRMYPLTNKFNSILNS